MKTRTILFLTFSIGILLGAVILWISREPQKGPRAEAAWAQAQQEAQREARDASAALEPGSEPTAAQEVRRLRKELARERELRRQLTREIEAYEAQLVSFQEERSVLDAAADAAEELPGRSELKTVMQEKLDRFETHVLSAEGFDEDEIERIQRRWEQSMIEKQEMLDFRSLGKPMPEGMGFNQIRTSMREDLGEDGYDAMLFATKSPNRVVVSSLLVSSPAYIAGLRVGDVIYSYDDVRVFKPMLLDQMARRAELGETRKIEVIDETGISSFYIETGPTGAIFGSAIGRPTHY